MVGIGVIFFIFAPQLVSIFTDTKEVQEMVVKVLRLIALFQPFAAITQIFSSALQGAGGHKISNVYNTNRNLGCKSRWRIFTWSNIRVGIIWCMALDML